MQQKICLLPLIFVLCVSARAFEIDDYVIVDLSHTYDEATLYWPTSTSRFEKSGSAGMSDGGWFYSAYSVCTPEHGGTHLDAPVHFSADGVGTDKIPLENLVAPAVVIDVADNAEKDRNYRLSKEDVLAFENGHGPIAAGTMVLLRTGWSQSGHA
jgi:kynurenine formamidase